VNEPSTDIEPVFVQASEGPAPTPRVEERPGVLRGGATLTLQTRQAQRLVKGRGQTEGKPAIIGLIGFANMLRMIWHGARADDPYADWWMLKVHDALQLAQEQLACAGQEIATRFDAMGSIDVSAPASIKPARIALNFSNPYAFRGAQLVSAYDALVRSVLSARHVGLLTRDESERALHEGGRQVRRALQSPVGYRFTGVWALVNAGHRMRRQSPSQPKSRLQHQSTSSRFPIAVNSSPIAQAIPDHRRLDLCCYRSARCE